MVTAVTGAAEDDDDAPVRYLIVCAARTGSTMLATCLEQHPDVVAHGEVFGRSGPLAFVGLRSGQDVPLERALVELRDRDPVSFLYDFVFQAGRFRAVGCKFKYEELLIGDYSTVLAAIQADTGIHVIHLRRDDLLERYLSQHLAVEVTKVFNVRDEDARPPEVTVRLDPGACQEDFEQTAERVRRFEELFADHPVLDLTYQELLDDLDGVLQQVHAHLGVGHLPVEPLTKRLRHRSPRETIENYDELADHFAGGPFEHLFAPVGS